MSKKYYQRNIEYYREYQRKYRAKNREKYKEWQKRWIEKKCNGIHPEILARFGRNPKEIFERDNWECQNCGSKENLLIHHKDENGRRSKIVNNNLDNLITMCQSCHSRLHRIKYLKQNSGERKV